MSGYDVYASFLCVASPTDAVFFSFCSCPAYAWFFWVLARHRYYNGHPWAFQVGASKTSFCPEGRCRAGNRSDRVMAMVTTDQSLFLPSFVFSGERGSRRHPRRDHVAARCDASALLSSDCCCPSSSSFSFYLTSFFSSCAYPWDSWNDFCCGCDLSVACSVASPYIGMIYYHLR